MEGGPSGLWTLSFAPFIQNLASPEKSGCFDTSGSPVALSVVRKARKGEKKRGKREKKREKREKEREEERRREKKREK